MSGFGGAYAPPNPDMNGVASGVVGADGRDLELQGHLLADEDTARLERGVPVHAPVLAVDGRPTLEPDAVVAERVDGRTGVVEVDAHRLGHALDREVADHTVFGITGLLDRRRPEADLRILVHRE